MSNLETENLHSKSRNAAVVMGSVGVAAIGFGGFSLFIITMQDMFLSMGPSGTEIEEMRVIFDVFHGLFRLWMPLLCLTGVFWVVCGVLLGFGGVQWRPLALIATAVGGAWVIGYGFGSIEYIEAFQELIMSKTPEIDLPISSFMNASVWGSILMLLTIPVASAVIVWRAQ